MPRKWKSRKSGQSLASRRRGRWRKAWAEAVDTDSTGPGRVLLPRLSFDLLEPGMKDADLHWLAGFLEGEGSFMVCNQKRGDRNYVFLRIAAVGTDRDVIERCATILGGKLNGPFTHSNPRAKKFYRATLHGQEQVRMWCELLRPLMGERRQEQIDKVLVAEHPKVVV